jgi:hypothetical protein
MTIAEGRFFAVTVACAACFPRWLNHPAGVFVRRGGITRQHATNFRLTFHAIGSMVLANGVPIVLAA